MRNWHKELAASIIIGALCLGMGAVVSADEKSQGAATKQVYSFWTLPQQSGAITVIAQGSDTPKTVEIGPATVIDGMCVHCMLPLKFKSTETKKNCSACGCAVSNADCIAGKATKGTPETMFQGLPRGAVLRFVYNDADKAESGIKNISIDFNSVFLAVDGLSGQTPAQLAALVKPIGGTKAELLDNGKHLTFTVKEGWVHETFAKFEKILVKAGGKIVQPEKVAATN